jgi:two-component system cell cycle response regulator
MPLAAADIIEQLSELPPFSKVTTRLLSMLDDESVSFQEISQVISTDPSLVMKVLQMSNSPFYMVSHPIESIKDAVLILGITTLKHLTTSISVQKGLSKLTPRKDVFDMLAFWKHSYAMAIASSELSRRKSAVTSDRFYLAGLIHDTGKLVQAYYWPEAWKATINLLKAGSESFENVEQYMFTIPHRKITSTLCRNWQFPEKIVVLLEQDRHSECNEAHSSEREMIFATANAIINARGFHFPVEEIREVPCENLDQYADIMDTLESEVGRQLSILNG